MAGLVVGVIVRRHPTHWAVSAGQSPPLGLYDHDLRHQFRWIFTAQCRQMDQRGQVTKYTEDSSNFGADGPFFQIIREGLTDLVDGEDYFDLLADNVVFEYVISVPGYPKRVEGRQNIIDLYSDYDSFLNVRSADNLHVYRDPVASVVVLEYEVHGESVQTGRPYDNRFASIVTIRDGKVARWRDYLDPVAVFDATGWPGV
ncbi:MAG: nuclear transport factor 2 family protein [Acidimicrobiales bacterium]